MRYNRLWPHFGLVCGAMLVGQCTSWTLLTCLASVLRASPRHTRKTTMRSLFLALGAKNNVKNNWNMKGIAKRLRQDGGWNVWYDELILWALPARVQIPSHWHYDTASSFRFLSVQFANSKPGDIKHRNGSKMACMRKSRVAIYFQKFCIPVLPI